MDGIANVLGLRTVPLKIDEKTYTLTPMVLAEYAEREAYILNLRPDPFKTILALPDSVSSDDRRFLMEQALKQAQRAKVVSLQELGEFEDSLHGIAWNLMRALRKHHPDEATFQGAMAVIEKAGDLRLREIVQILSLTEEKDILGNSTSPVPAVTPGADSLGPNSSADSQNNTAGTFPRLAE